MSTPNIIVIVSDTLRRDHLGCYGNKVIHTPHLDKFSQKSIQFDNCYAASFLTMPYRADLFTGKWTVTYLGWALLPTRENVMAELLFNAEYTTVGVVDTPFFVRRGYQYDRGFKDFIWIRGRGAERSRVNSERRCEEDHCAPKTMLAAEKCLEYYHKEKFFLDVDTWDPHEPWDPPDWYVKLYDPHYAGETVAPCYWDWREFGVEEKDIKLAHACYCGEVTMVDAWVGRLLDKVEAMGLGDNTVILFTCDRGFYFGEHGYFGKGKEKGNPLLQAGRHKDDLYFERVPWKKAYWYRSPLYEEVTRAPLLLYVPGKAARRIGAMVSAVDLMPTILELAEVKMPESVHGRSLLPLIEGKKEAARDFTVTSCALYNLGEKTRMVDDWERRIKELQPSTIASEKWTLLYTAESHPAELYNTERDPRQKENIIDDNWEVAEDLHRKFVGLLQDVGTNEASLAPRRRLSRL